MATSVKYKETSKHGQLDCTAGFQDKEHWLLKIGGGYTFLFVANENDPYSYLKYVKRVDGGVEVVADSRTGDVSQLEFYFNEECAFVEDESGKLSVEKVRAYLSEKIERQR